MYSLYTYITNAKHQFNSPPPARRIIDKYQMESCNEHAYNCFFAFFLISEAADLLPNMKAEVRLSAPSFERLPEPAKTIL